jgi:AraC family transcriptional regulator
MKLAQEEVVVSRQTLFRSDFYTIGDFHCYSNRRYTFKPAYTDDFCINFPRRGYYTFQAFRRKHEEYNSRILIEKPGCEFTLTQELAGEGSCTIFRFTPLMYEGIIEKYGQPLSSFFRNENIYSVMVAGNPESEYLHYAILQAATLRQAQGSGATLELDVLVMEMIDTVMTILGNNDPSCDIPENNKRYHIGTIERAKEYMMENFTRDISLHELARHCYVSPFHFSRLFKQFTSWSPYQFLKHIRLKHAERLIRVTQLPITDVCFHRLDYFSAAFAKRYAISPTGFRSLNL